MAIYNSKIYFSLIIPTYNNAGTIIKTINKLLELDYDNYELIVVNDGSSDNTKEVLAGFTDNKLRVINQENQGVSAARNAGIKSAKGHYIIFIDDDDDVADNILSVLERAIVGNGYPDYVRYSGMRQNATGKNEKIIGFSGKRILEQMINPKYGFCCYTPLIAIKNSNRITLFHEEIHHLEDLVFYVDNVANPDATVVDIENELYFYRYNPRSRTKSVDNLKKNIDSLGCVASVLHSSKNIKTWRQKKLIDSNLISVFFWRIRDAEKQYDKNTIARIIHDGLLSLRKSNSIPVFFVQPKSYLRYLYLKLFYYRWYRQ